MPDQISFIEHPSDVIAHAAALVAQGRRFALITSIAIEGGAAREVGSLALVDDRGQMVGYLSNGCIDKDIQLHAQAALASDDAALIRYGEGSYFADLKLPCGGALSVLIDPKPAMGAILEAHGAFKARRLAKMIFRLPDGADVTFTYPPKFRLVIAGRGAVFRAMAQVTKSTGFQLFALSPDEDDIAAVAALTEAPPVHLTSPDHLISFDMLDEHAAFLTLFHDHDWEPELLRAALLSPAFFIGSLGSRRTHNVRLARLASSGETDVELARLQGPIGLVPSLREAPLIAVSAMAEIITALPKGNPPQ